MFVKRTRFILLNVCLFSLFFVQCHKKQKKTETKTIPEVATITIKRETLPYFVRLPGTFLPYETVNLYAKASGFIDVINVDRGSIVHKDDILAQLVDPRLDREVERAHVTYLAENERYARARPVTPKTVSPEHLAGLKGKSDSSFKEWKALLAQKQFLTITAPFDGIITTRYLHTGALVNEGAAPVATPVVKIDRLDRLRLVVFVHEADIGGVTEGTEIPFSVSSYPNQKFTARVARIARSLNLKTLTEPVEFDVYNPDFTNPIFMPGMLANIDWPATRAQKTFVVPKNAIVTTTYDMFVIRIKNDLTEWVSVTRGNYYQDKVEIFGTLDDGDQIVINATDQLRENVKINIRNRG